MNKINGQIKKELGDITHNVRLVGNDGEQLGIVTLQYAFNRARQEELDLIMVVEQAQPPVCRLGNYGKWQYHEQKKEKERRKKNRANQIDVKEIWLRPNTEEHDLATKAKQASKFLEKGNHVKVGVKFKGREQSFMDQGRERIQDIANRVGGDTIKDLQQNGKTLFMVIGPKNDSKKESK